MAVQQGWTVAWLYAAHRVLTAVSKGRAGVVAYELVAQPVGAGKLDTVRDDPNTVIDIVTATDTLVHAFPRPLVVNQGRWAQGATCYAATVKGDFAGTIWIQKNLYQEDEVRCDFVLPDPQTVWDFDVYVVPRLRLGRTMGRLWKAVDAALVRQGVRWTFSRISCFNPESLKAHSRLGAIAVGQIIVLRLGPIQCSYARTEQGRSVNCSFRTTRVPIRVSAPKAPAVR